jgi:hypothetical protein
MTATISWTPLYRDWATNHKFRIISRRCGQPLVVVSAISAQMLCPAWWCEPGQLRADFQSFIATALDIDDDIVVAVYEAMQGLFLDGDRLRGWETRRLLSRSSDGMRPVSLTPAAAKKRSQRQRLAEQQQSQKRLDLDVPKQGDIRGTSGGTCPPECPPFPGDMSPGFPLSDQPVTDVCPLCPLELEEEEKEDSRIRSFGAGAHAAPQYGGVDGVVVLERQDPVLIEFRLWWARCDNPVGEAAALAEYRLARGAGATAGEIAEGWIRYAAVKPPDRQWLNPANFLAQRRWTDRPAALRPTSQGPPRPEEGDPTIFPFPRGPNDERPRLRTASRAADKLDADRAARRASLAAAVARRMAHGVSA